MPILYEQIAEKLKERLKVGLGEKLHSLVLYGSVAKGEALEDSDIDLLIITADKRSKELVLSISSDLDFEYEYKTLIAPVHLSKDEFYHLVKLGSPFLSNVMEEGKVLYDDGTYEGVRRKLLTQSK